MKKNKRYNRDLSLSPAKARSQTWHATIVDYYLKGSSYLEIVELAHRKIGKRFTTAYIGRCVKAAAKEWTKTRSDYIDRQKSLELAKINRLEMEYWTAWEASRSIQKSKSKTKEATPKGGLKISHIRDDEKTSAGDPRFLQGIQWCVDARIKVLGLQPELAPPGPTTQILINNNPPADGTPATTTIMRRIVFRTRESHSEQIVNE